MDDELIIRRASYALELVDGLTGGPLVGSSQVAFELTGPPVAGPEPVMFLVNRSRWVFEQLQNDVVFSIEAEHYLPEKRTVTAAELTGALAIVAMSPRTGYPFPPALTRAVGSVRLVSGEPVPDATVMVTPLHLVTSSSTFIAGPTLTARTADDGQYVVWFRPQTGLSDPSAQPTASRFNAVASATVDIGGVPTPVSGSIVDQQLVPETLNGADDIHVL